jgi:hypothetical protein
MKIDRPTRIGTVGLEPEQPILHAKTQGQAGMKASLIEPFARSSAYSRAGQKLKTTEYPYRALSLFPLALSSELQ